MTKQCFVCKKTFPINMFYVTHNNRFFSYCKSCHIMKNKKQNNKESIHIDRGGFLQTIFSFIFSISHERALHKFAHLAILIKRLYQRSLFT